MAALDLWGDRFGDRDAAFCLHGDLARTLGPVVHEHSPLCAGLKTPYRGIL
jgi:hypothetical protein